MKFKNIEVGESLYLEVKETVSRVIAHEIVVTTTETFFLEVPVVKVNKITFDVNADFDSDFDYYPQSSFGVLRYSRESGKCLDKEYSHIRLFSKGEQVEVTKYIASEDRFVSSLREVKCQWSEYQEWTRGRYYLDELLKQDGTYCEIPQEFNGIAEMFKFAAAALNDLTPNKVKDVKEISDWYGVPLA